MTSRRHPAVTDHELLGELRRSCPDLDRACAETVEVFVADGRVFHAREVCGETRGFATRVSLFDVADAVLCGHCTRALSTRVERLVDVVSVLRVLASGPCEFGEDPGDADMPFGAAVHNAATFTALRRSAQHFIRVLPGGDVDALEELLVELYRPWETWFESVGADELTLLARLAGPDAMANGRELDPCVQGLPALSFVVDPAAFAVSALSAFAQAHFEGAGDVSATAVEYLLGDCRLFFDAGPVNASSERVAELAASGLDLAQIVDLVGVEGRRRDCASMVRVLEERVSPAGEDAWVVLVVNDFDWAAQFWSDALSLSFPSACSSTDERVVALPVGVAAVTRGWRRWSGQGGEVPSVPVPDRERAVEVVSVAAVLLDDGLDTDVVLGTALGTLR